MCYFLQWSSLFKVTNLNIWKKYHKDDSCLLFSLLNLFDMVPFFCGYNYCTEENIYKVSVFDSCYRLGKLNSNQHQLDFWENYYQLLGFGSAINIIFADLQFQELQCDFAFSWKCIFQIKNYAAILKCLEAIHSTVTYFE